MVRVKSRELIDLQRAQLRAAALEAEIRELARDTQRLKAQGRAAELAPIGTEAGQVRECLMDDLPMTAGGDLHESAFLALVDAQVWKQCEQWLAEELERKKA